MVKAIIIAMLMAGLALSPAHACGILQKANPKVGASVKNVKQLELNFSEAIIPAESSVSLIDASGRDIKADAVKILRGDTALLLPLQHALAPDKYKVAWHVLWKDCASKTGGHYSFTVK